MDTYPLVDLGHQYRALRSELLDTIARVLDNGQYILGQEVALLEQELATYCGVNSAVGVANGTDALVLLLRAFGIGPGDEVITTPFTFFATAEAIMQAGALPVFVDVDPETFLMTASQVEKHTSPRTKAILVVHLFGQMANMVELRACADAHHLYLFEDACQAAGAQWDGRGIGALGDGAAISFFPTKNLGTYGDGGMVLLNDPDRAERVRRLRVHGSVRKYEHEEVGWNSRLDELHAAILRVKLRKLEEWTNERIAIANRYHEALQDLPLSLPVPLPHARHVYHLYTVATPLRDALKQALADAGIGSGVYYPVPLHLQTALHHLGYRRGDFPTAERLTQEVLSIPIYPGLTREAQDLISHAVRRFFSV